MPDFTDTTAATESTQKPMPEGVKDETVTLKPDAIEKKGPAKDENFSDVPYHNKETEKIASDRKPEAKKDYTYSANGYTITEFTPDTPLAGTVDSVPPEYRKSDDEPVAYKVTADDFERVFVSKRDAEIYVETHAAAHKDLPATISKT